MYSLSDYGRMIADRVRMEAYAQALRRTVTPDSVVLDIGTGTGILALLACQFGARRVYALEPSDVIQVAREAAVVNGMTQRIDFIQSLSTDVTMPERADVIVSDLRGILPLHQQHIPAILDARKRWLAPHGVLIPQRDMLWAGLAEAPDVYNQCVSPWEERPYGLDISAARRIAVNTWSKAHLQPEQLLVPLSSGPHWITPLWQILISAPKSCGRWLVPAPRMGSSFGLIPFW